MTNPITVTYGGVKLTDFFQVKNIQRSILPPREVSLLSVPEKHGAYFMKARYGIREISMEIKVRATTAEEYMNTLRFLAYCFDIEEPSDLEISDEPTKVQYAILSGSTDMVNEIMEIGKGSLTFLCPDPFAYSTELKTITPVNKKFTFNNLGTTSTYPIFNTVFNGSATFLSLTSPDGIVLIGNPSEKDKIILPKTSYILNDPMESTGGWVTAGNVLDANRENLGTVAVFNSAGIGPSSYGTGTYGNQKWHGPAIRKDLSELLSHFTVKARINAYSQDGTSTLDGKQLGRLEIYLFNQSGAKIGKMVMRDSYDEFEYNEPEIFIGNAMFLEQNAKLPTAKKVNQKLYVTYTVKKGDTWASIAKAHKMSANSLASLNGKTTASSLPKGTKLKVYDKTVTKTVWPEHVGNWNDFYGEFTLSRVGTTWYAEVSRFNADTLKKTRTIKKTFYDKEGIYSSAQLSYIVIHFAQFETYAPMGNLRVTDLKVIKHNVDTVIDIPALFSAGDELEVDFTDSSVRLNGELFMDEVDIGSSFFPIQEGTTEVIVNTNDTTATFSAEFQERFL